MPEGYTWSELIAKAFSMHLNLSTMFLTVPKENNGDLTIYDIDAAGCTEVLVDVLTGETQVTRTDILYDSGQRFGRKINKILKVIREVFIRF
jgi:xanthine dehydrogenase molybdopterin-binding subunit B